MKIILVHNYYQFPGGEDLVFAAEGALLRRHGHEVVEFTENNQSISSINRLTIATRTIWSRQARHQLLQILRDCGADLVHFHNTFPLISPSGYAACREAEVPVVQTLHNYRLLCPAATFYREGRVCEECLGRTFPWPSIRYGCYRKSRVETSVVAAMLTIHRRLKSYLGQVDMYIAPTEIARRKYIQGGLPPDKIVVKPNFLHEDPGFREEEGQYAFFVGRLSEEKGIWTLLQAWQKLTEVPLKVVGDGPLMDEVRAFVQVQHLKNVEVLGQCSPGIVLRLMKGARFLIFPSESFETFGRVAMEAFACGIPVVASRLGAMAEIVKEGRTGLFFNPGDPEDLTAKVKWAWRHRDETHRMGREARAEYERKYTATCNYEMLMSIYHMAIARQRTSAGL